MECANCKNCRFPRSEKDNNGNCKCKIMKNKTIDVYVCGGETPEWCPLNNNKETVNEKIENAINEIYRRYSEMVYGKRTLSISDYHNFVLNQLNNLKDK